MKIDDFYGRNPDYMYFFLVSWTCSTMQQWYSWYKNTHISSAWIITTSKSKDSINMQSILPHHHHYQHQLPSLINSNCIQLHLHSPGYRCVVSLHIYNRCGTKDNTNFPAKFKHSNTTQPDEILLKFKFKKKKQQNNCFPSLNSFISVGWWTDSYPTEVSHWREFLRQMDGNCCRP